MRSSPLPAALRAFASAASLLLVIEFMDEFAFGAREAAWPLIRTDLGLSYVQVGLLLAIPEVVSGIIEPALGILGDTRWRSRLILGGGIGFSVAFVAAGASASFLPLLVAFVLMYPASGAFVALSQASLMDASPGDHEQAMARWTFAGSIGVVLGPLALAAASLTFGGWRALFVACAVFAMLLVVALRRRNAGGGPASEAGSAVSFNEAARGALRAARRRTTWCWLAFLAASDLMVDGLFGFLALYLVDGAGLAPAQSALAIGVWAATGLLGDGLLIPVLRRVPGLVYLRFSAIAMLGLYAGFLGVPGFVPKLFALALMGLLNAGWYAILQARLYASLPGQSGAVVAISSAFGLVEAAIPIVLGLVAQRFGISVAMVFLAAGPVVLIAALPRSPGQSPADDPVIEPVG